MSERKKMVLNIIMIVVLLVGAFVFSAAIAMLTI